MHDKNILIPGDVGLSAGYRSLELDANAVSHVAVFISAGLGNVVHCALSFATE